MTLSISTQVSPIGAKLIVDTVANATAKNAVTGTSGTVYMIDIDNTANTSASSYFKIYDAASPTIGTTVPDHVFKIPSSQRRCIAIPEGLDFTNLSYACTTAGGTTGTTAPTNAVVVRMIAS
jgi:hypothetical protein